MEGSATVTDYTTISTHELVEKVATMSKSLAANPPPGFDTNEWNALARALVLRIPGIEAVEFDRAGGY